MELKKVVCCIDPILDTSLGTIEEFRDYLDTRDFSKIQKFIPSGMKHPTVFFLKEISNLVFVRYVQTGATQEERFLRAFRASVTRVDHLIQADGVTLPSWEPSLDSDGIMREESLERFRPFQIAEIGGVAYTQSFLAPGIAVSYAVPDMSLRVLAERVFQSAVVSLNSQPTSNENPSSLSEVSP